MASDSEVVMVSEVVASATSDSDAWEVVPDKNISATTTTKQPDVSTADTPTTTKAEVKEEVQVIQEEPEVIPDEPDFSPVKDPSHIEPMEVPHEDEDAICHSLAKASLSPLEPPKVKRFVAVPVATPSEDGQPTDLLNKGGGALPINPLRLNIPLDDHAERQDKSGKKDAEPAKTPVDQQGHRDPKLTGNKGAEQTNLMAAPAIPKRSFLRAGLDSTSAGEDASPLLQDFIRPKPKGSARPVSPKRSRSQRRPREASPARRARDKAARDHKGPINNPKDKSEFMHNIGCFAETLDGIAPFNLHVAAYFYQPSKKYPLTHPRQLSAVTLRRNSREERRWICWQCSPDAGYDRQECYTVNDHSCHWWSCHAGEAEWQWWDDALRYEITMAEILQICGIDIRREPLPLSSIHALPRHLPSHPSGSHDQRLFEHPYNLGVANPNTISELKLAEWYNQWSLIPYEKHRDEYMEGPSSEVQRVPVPPAEAPPSHIRSQGDAVTSFGWFKVVPDLTDKDPDSMVNIISPANDLEEYCNGRKDWHKSQTRTPWLRDLLLEFEEHAFYLTLIKLMGSKILANFPIRLSDSESSDILKALWTYPADLERRMNRGLAGVRCNSAELEDYIRQVQAYVSGVIRMEVPVKSPWSIPKAPAHDQIFNIRLSYTSS